MYRPILIVRWVSTNTLNFGRSKFASITAEVAFAFYMKIIQDSDGSFSYESISDIESIDVKRRLLVLL